MSKDKVPKADKDIPKACDIAIEKIDLILDRLMCLEAVVLNRNPEQKPVVESTLRLVLAAMRELDSSAASLSDVEVPAKLLQWLDEGKDPDAFFKTLFDDTIWASQVCSYCCVNCTSSLPTQVCLASVVSCQVRLTTLHVQVMKGKLDAISSGKQGLETELQGPAAAEGAAVDTEMK